MVILVLIGALLATACAVLCVLNPDFQIVRGLRPWAGLAFIVYLLVLTCAGILS